MADFMNRADVVGSGFQKPQLESYLATVTQTLLTEADFLPHVKDSNGNIDEHTIYYNENKNFTDKNVRNLGAIKFSLEDSRNFVDYAFPFDKNNFTFPIAGETVIIIQIDSNYFYLKRHQLDPEKRYTFVRNGKFQLKSSLKKYSAVVKLPQKSFKIYFDFFGSSDSSQ